jgi:hypothetical protein
MYTRNGVVTAILFKLWWRLVYSLYMLQNAGEDAKCQACLPTRHYILLLRNIKQVIHKVLYSKAKSDSCNGQQLEKEQSECDGFPPKSWLNVSRGKTWFLRCVTLEWDFYGALLASTIQHDGYDWNRDWPFRPKSNFPLPRKDSKISCSEISQGFYFYFGHFVFSYFYFPNHFQIKIHVINNWFSIKQVRLYILDNYNAL